MTPISEKNTSFQKLILIHEHKNGECNQKNCQMCRRGAAEIEVQI
jgi:hypothetical protein